MPEETPAPTPGEIETWLAEFDLVPVARAERDGIAALDVVLDGRRRRDLRITLILDPAIGLICWAQLAPPIGDGLRKAYRTLLRWNDEFPFAKFSVSEDGRPILAVELARRDLGPTELGRALARACGIADALFAETAGWLWIGGRIPAGYDAPERRNGRLLDRFAADLPELLGA